MKIKFKIAVLFTLLVILIFLLLGTAVYYFSSLNRKSEFSQRLRNRALTTTRLLLELEEMNKPLLKKIDSLNMNLLFAERISIYNDKNEVVYINRSQIADPLNPTVATLDKIRTKKEYRFSLGEYEGIGTMYNEGTNNYVVVSTAIDVIGRNALEQLKKILLLSGLAGVVITMLAGYLFSINLLRPLARINTEMNEISLQNISRRIAVKNNKDELNQLADTFNNLLERLEISFNNQKRFIGNASHELSTPLAAISSQLDVALMQNRSEQEYKTVLSSVQEDVLQLNNLVRKLLELAKAGAGKGISLKPVRLDEIVLHAADEIHELYPDYRVSVSFMEIPEDESLCYIYGNEELLYISFKNMIENACKYSASHKASISVSMMPDKKIISISDDGIGIEKEEMEKIFEPFYRSPNTSKNVDGTGLGLTLSSRIIRLHKGEIIINSQPGKGSIFTITFSTD